MIDEAYIRANARTRQNRVECPACAPTRRSRHERTLSLTLGDKGIVWQCWHCGLSGLVADTQRERPRMQPARSVIVPAATFRTDELSERALAYLAKRGISEATAKRCRIASGDRLFARVGEAAAIGFPYFNAGTAYACKWRMIDGKIFTQSGSAQTLWMADQIVDGTKLIISEGELDAASYWQAGLEYAASLPSGAINENISDNAARLSWIGHHEQLLRDAKDIYLSGDGDGPGAITNGEIARRVGKYKCWQLTYPADCKDANDVLMKHGEDGVRRLIEDATPWPVEGLTLPSNYMDKVDLLYREGLKPGLSTGWAGIDKLFTLVPGSLTILTGVPGNGKSTWLDGLLVNAMKRHDWHVAYASFETPQDIHLARLAALYRRQPFRAGPTKRMGREELTEAMEFLERHVTFLVADGARPTVASLIDRFEASVMRYGSKACVVDPYNFVRMATKQDGGIDTEAINEFLSECKMFAARAEVAFFLVAHPAKPIGMNADWIPTGYSISGSANFFNRADAGLTVHRKGSINTLVSWKARFGHLGSLGECRMRFDPATEEFNEEVALDAEFNLDEFNGYARVDTEDD